MRGGWAMGCLQRGAPAAAAYPPAPSPASPELMRSHPTLPEPSWQRSTSPPAGPLYKHPHTKQPHTKHKRLLTRPQAAERQLAMLQARARQLPALPLLAIRALRWDGGRRGGAQHGWQVWSVLAEPAPLLQGHSCGWGGACARAPSAHATWVPQPRQPLPSRTWNSVPRRSSRTKRVKCATPRPSSASSAPPPPRHSALSRRTKASASE